MSYKHYYVKYSICGRNIIGCSEPSNRGPFIDLDCDDFLTSEPWFLKRSMMQSLSGSKPKIKIICWKFIYLDTNQNQDLSPLKLSRTLIFKLIKIDQNDL